MKVIIAGSRGLRPTVEQVQTCVTLSGYDITEVVCGGAMGPDMAGKKWAEKVGVFVKMFPADWNTHGKAAGFLRNKRMGEYADGLVAIWDCESRGTVHMIRYMQQMEKPYYVFTLESDGDNGVYIRLVNSSFASR